MDLITIFGNNVRKYRLKTGLSQEAFAEKCGVHRTYISQVERCITNATLENIEKIANGLGIEAWKLFAAEDN